MKTHGTRSSCSPPPPTPSLIASRIVNARKVNLVRRLLREEICSNETIVSIVKGNVILFDDNTRCTRLESKWADVFETSPAGLKFKLLPRFVHGRSNSEQIWVIQERNSIGRFVCSNHDRLMWHSIWRSMKSFRIRSEHAFETGWQTFARRASDE